MQCYKCNSEEVVYSGVDAFILECMEKIQNICYPCANEELKEKRANEEMVKQTDVR